MKQNKTTRPFVRFMAIILAALMVLGSIALIVQLFTNRTAALGNAKYENPLLRVGFDYASGVVDSSTVSSQDGFILGRCGSDNVLTPLFSITSSKVTVSLDCNLSKDGDDYLRASEAVIIGGYHLEDSHTYSTRSDAERAVSQANSALSNSGFSSSLIYAFCAYRQGAYAVRIGDFGSLSNAASYQSSVQTCLPNAKLAVVSPNDQALTVIDPTKECILFEFADSSNDLALKPATNGNATKVASGRSYLGAFLFSRYGDGIAVTNLIDTETYVQGVLPYEVGNTWPHECLKAFAICVRSFAFASNKHAKYNIDVCNSACCQAYRGTDLVNSNVQRAVSETEGLVMCYDGKPCSAMYSAVTGSCTVNAKDLYNYGDVPYLRAVQTPWERYEEHPMGLWANSVSGHELYLYLRGTKGYTALTNDITDIHIDRLAENSTYVYAVTVTDADGHKQSVEGTYRIYSMFAKYTNCSNFMLYHKGALQGTAFYESNYTVLTATGKSNRFLSPNGTVPVLTAEGVVNCSPQNITAATASGLADVPFGELKMPDVGKKAIESATDQTFVFVGKGWGHGCGLSQWGAMNYAQDGASCDEILHAYFTDITIEDYSSIKN